jgi:hypothetical protein
VSGFAGDRVTAPVVSCRPAALVTEMIANRGSTASSWVSETVFGGNSRTPLAVGSVRIR